MFIRSQCRKFSVFFTISIIGSFSDIANFSLAVFANSGSF